MPGISSIKNALGSCPDYLLLEALAPTRMSNVSDPSNEWSDYEDKTSLPDNLKPRVGGLVDLMEL